MKNINLTQGALYQIELLARFHLQSLDTNMNTTNAINTNINMNKVKNIINTKIMCWLSVITPNTMEIVG